MQSTEYRYDLHTHTFCSDGTLSPEELVQRAVDNQVTVLAITDHDTIEALKPASQFILQNELPLTLINGVEISTYWRGFDIHIVGLNIDPQSEPLTALLAQQYQRRIERAVLIDKRLQKRGIEGAYEAATKLASKGTIARPHFAQYLVDIGVVKNTQAAFNKYLKKGAYAYIPTEWCSIKEAVQIIHASGGVAVLAHPLRYDISAKWLKMLLDDFKTAEGDAIEVLQNRQTPDDNQRLARYAIEYELLASQGSDFHYTCPWNDVGKIAVLPSTVKPVWHNWYLTR